jgi:hypothetical protein
LTKDPDFDILHINCCDPTSFPGGIFVFLAGPTVLSKYHGRSEVPVKGRRKTLAGRIRKDYFCNVVSEDVEIVLKRNPSLSPESKNELFVQCNQTECQYVDLNQSPCPLRLDLFAEEIGKRQNERTIGKMAF